MEIELLDIREHLARFAPFEGLSDEHLDQLVECIEIAYFKAGSEILALGQEIHDLGYIRSGAVEIYRRNGDLYDRRGEGDIFGHFSLLRNRKVHFPAKAFEDTLVYFISADMFHALCEADENFADFVELERPRLKSVVEEQRQSNNMMITRIRKLVSRRPLLVEEDTTVQETARRMNEENVSSALVLSTTEGDPRYQFDDPAGRRWTLKGIVTDQDFRNRVLAEGHSAMTAVGHIATDGLISVQSDVSVHESMLVMLRNNIHHLPVLHRRNPVGIVHLSDILRYETHSSLYLVSNIFHQLDVLGLARLKPDVREAFVRMVEEGANSQMVGAALSTIGRSFTRRLLELAEEQFGPPPVPYCFMVLGSMARNEQSIITDQDHALVLDDSFDPLQHDDYFAAMAKHVSDGLDACGYTYCKGQVMATNTKWRQPLRVWKRYFSEWIERPHPEHLLHSSIFFDLDSVHGEEAFVEQLQDLVATKASVNPLFLAAMARNALGRTPPLGLFRTFVMEKDGKHNNTINLKRRGTAPLVDLIRVHALACGSRAQNSVERLDDIAKTQLLPEGASDKIRYAFEFLSMVRMRHQAIALQQEGTLDNTLAPDTVSDSERHNLKGAFQVLSNAQKFLKFRYPLPPRSP